METIIGIDLGTTNSLCSFFQNEQPILIPNAHGEVLTPSVVGILDNGEVVIGSAAKELRVTKPAQTASCFKRYMGTDRELTVGKKKYSSTELSSLVLRSLKNDAEAFLGREVDSAVITVPAYFNDNQRQATKSAGQMAGLKVRRIINEPTAAALTYGFHDRDAEKHILVIDLGGGTFDVTLMEIFESTLEIVSTAGESMLGGEDFTDRLVATVFKKEGIQLETAEIKQPFRVARLRQECEVAKRALLTEAKAKIRIPDKKGELSESKSLSLDRVSFSKIVKPLMERIKNPINRVLRDGECKPADVEEVILVGGATRMPVLQEFVSEYLECKPLTKFNPDEVVALGAAVQAALIGDDAAVEEMVMTDVCPFTLGVEIAKDFGGRIESGFYQPMIHRNTTIPVSCEEVLGTIYTNQQEVLCKVYQGESRKVKENLYLGELSIQGIPPGPAGTQISLRFTYDLNGLLEVEAMLPSTGKKFQTVLTNNSATLSNFELKKAIEAMQQLKFYPRDELKHQRLVLFSERMVGEVSPYQRTQLEEAIDMFEMAMSSGDREVFKIAREGLLMTLSGLGVAYQDDGGEEGFADE